MQHLLPNNNHARKRRLLPLADKEKYLPAAGPWPVFSALFFIVHTLLNFVFMKALFKHALLIIAGTLLCLFNSCKPEEKPHPNIYKGPYYLGEVKDYLYFKPGSYWIYKNNVTNQIDTWTMLSIDTAVKQTDLDLPDAHYYCTYTDLRFYYWSTLLKNKIGHSLYPPVAHNFGYAIERNYIYQNFPSTYNYFNIPFLPSQDTTQVYSSTANYFRTLYNLRCGPYTFDSAVQLRVYDDIWPRSSVVKNSLVLADHFWVKGVGLTKIYIRSYYPETIETWELIEFKIIK
jgi:hypothetical protein